MRRIRGQRGLRFISSTNDSDSADEMALPSGESGHVAL